MKNLFSTQNFWVALLTLFVLIMGVFVPGYALDVPHAAALAVVCVGYMVSLAMAPAVFNWGSRKFWLTMLTMAVLILDSFHVFPGTLDVASLSAAVTAVVIYTISLAKDPGLGWAGTLVSRKFWGFVVTIAVVILRAFNLALPMDISVEQLAALIVVPITLILTAAFGKEPIPVDLEIPDDTGPMLGAG